MRARLPGTSSASFGVRSSFRVRDSRPQASGIAGHACSLAVPAWALACSDPADRLLRCVRTWASFFAGRGNWGLHRVTSKAPAASHETRRGKLRVDALLRRGKLHRQKKMVPLPRRSPLIAKHASQPESAVQRFGGCESDAGHGPTQVISVCVPGTGRLDGMERQPPLWLTQVALRALIDLCATLGALS